MMKTNLIGSIAVVLGLALTFGLAGTTPAVSKSAEEKAAEEKYDLGVRRARAVQIYLKSQEAVYALLDAEVKYSTARSKGDEAAMREHAAEMLVASTVATYWASIFNGHVQAVAERDEPKRLTATYLEYNQVAFENLRSIVGTNDLDDLNKRLDGPVANTLTGLRENVREIYAYIQAQW